MNKQFEKLEENGKVAVLISRDFGAGWSTWNHDNGELLSMDKEIVLAVKEGRFKDAHTIACEKTGEDVYDGGLKSCRVEWVEKGSAFRINEYDGSESLEIIGAQSYYVA